MSSYMKFSAVKAASGEAQVRLLFCAHCPNTLASDWSESTRFDCYLDLACSGCKAKWSVCRLCPNATSRLESICQMRRHFGRNHRPKAASVTAVPAAALPVETITQHRNENHGLSAEAQAVEALIQDRKENPGLSMIQANSPDADLHDDNMPSLDAGVPNENTVTTDDNWIASFDSSPTICMGGTPEPTEDRDTFSNESVYDDHSDNHARLDFQCFGNAFSASYFKNHHNGRGNKYLVAMSQFNRDTVAPFLDDAEVELQMYITFFVDSLTKPQRHYFAEILARVVPTSKSTTAQKATTTTPRSNETCLLLGNQTVSSKTKYRCEIPRSYKQIRCWILEGKYSMFNNLPRPSVHKVGDHACVLISDCIADLLGHGFPIHELGSNGSLTTDVPNTRIDFFSRAQTIMGNAKRLMGSSADQITVLWLTSWSDDFEPNYSIKGNRGSVWIKTITVALPANSSQSLVYTYPVAIGPKGADHDVAERFLLSSLKSFMHAPLPLLYNGRTKTMTSVYLETFASLQDQPERRDMLFLARGNGTYHARWGYAMDCALLKRVLIPCANCLESLKKEARDSHTFCTADWRSGTCNICSCWAHILPSKHLRFLPPKGYPADKVATDGLIPAVRLSFPILRQAVSEAHENMLNNSWTDKEVIAYLRAHCLSSKAIDEIVARAKNCYLMKNLRSTGDITSVEYLAITEEESICPELFQRWRLPSLWDDSIPLERYGDVPMHLLFLGVGKTLVLDIQEWLKAMNRHSTFVIFASNVLSSVEALQLGWCKVLRYSAGKFGGWVSENYLALVRIFKWIYAPIHQMELDATPFVVPETAQNQWNKAVNVKWLRLRGLDTTGNAIEVRDRVADYLKLPNGGPALLPTRGGPGKQVLCMLNRFTDMVYLLMSKQSDETHVRNVEVYVRLFLSEYNVFTEQLYGVAAENGTTPPWIAKYNFMSLLNLSEQIKEVGPLRTLWEGGTRGEGYLRLVKPQIKTGLKTNWQNAIMQSLLRSKSMSTLTREFTSIDIGDNSQYRVYPSAANLEMMWVQRKPLSVVVKNEEEFMAAYQCTVIKKICWMRFSRLAHVADINELSFFYFSREDGAQNFVLGDNTVGAMLLPRLAKTGLPKLGDEAVYSCITSDWSGLVHSSGFFSPVSRHNVE